MLNEGKIECEQIIDIICNYSDIKNIEPQTDLRRELGLNSLQVIYLIVEIEETFGVTVGEEKITDFKTVRDIVDFINKERTE